MSSKCQSFVNKVKEVINRLDNYENWSTSRKINFLSEYNINITEQDLQNTNNDCGYIVGSDQGNYFIVPDECRLLTEMICEEYENNHEEHAKCMREYRPKFENITQENITRITHYCEINNDIESILRKAPSSENKSILLLAFHYKANNIDIDSVDICSYFENDNDFVKINNACLNVDLVDSNNLLMTCHASNIRQTNIYDSYQRCIINNTVRNVDTSPRPQPQPLPQPQPSQQNNQPNNSSNTNYDTILYIIISIVIIIVIVGLICSSTALLGYIIYRMRN